MSDKNIPDDTERPNSAYKLTPKKQDDDKLIYYYSREKRLDKASDAVRNLYSHEKPARGGLLRPLIANKGRTFIFTSILLMCAVLFLINILDLSGSYNLAGNKITAQALKYEGAIIVLVKKTSSKNWLGKLRADTIYTGAVDIRAFPVKTASLADAGETGTAFMNRITFTGEAEQEFRFTLPFETDTVLLILQAGSKQARINLKVE